MGREVIFGYRFFHCEDCGLKWKEKCRDAQTPSESYCPLANEDGHPETYGGGVSPCGWEFHPEWPKDKYGEIAIEPDHKYGEMEEWDGKFGDEE